MGNRLICRTMVEDKPNQHPKTPDEVPADLGGEKPCMMDEMFDENFDLRPPAKNQGAKNTADRSDRRA